MARVILPFAFLALLKSSQTEGRTHFGLQCPFKWRDIYWFRSPDLVLVTYWYKEPVFTSEGKDLMNRTDVFHRSFTLHKIRVKIDQDIDAYWACCRFTLLNNMECTDWLFVKGTSTETKTVSTVTPTMPSFTPAVPAEENNGTLSLTISPETPTEGQNVTLSCTIDTEIDQDKWIVFWLQNKTVMFITDTNSSIVKPDNHTDTLNQFVNDSTSSDEIRHTFDDVFQYAFVSSNAFQHNLTIPVSSPLIGNTSWNCGNNYLSNLSNTLTIPAFAESMVTTSFTTQDPEELSTPTESDTKTTLSSTALDLKGKASTTTYIVAGSVSGIIVIVFAIVAVMIVRRRRRDKEIDTTEASDKRKEESRKEDVVMQENVLYVGSKENVDENIGYQDDELVMEDNVLYVSSNGDQGRGHC